MFVAFIVNPVVAKIVEMQDIVSEDGSEDTVVPESADFTLVWHHSCYIADLRGKLSILFTVRFGQICAECV